jgi:tetratricopeptide (TPR) repeat protein
MLRAVASGAGSPEVWPLAAFMSDARARFGVHPAAANPAPQARGPAPLQPGHADGRQLHTMTTMITTNTHGSRSPILARRIGLALAIALAAGMLPGCQSPLPFKDRGDAAMQGARYDDAVANYAEFLRIRPGDAEVRAAYGRALARATPPRFPEAAESLRVAIMQQPNNPTFRDDWAEVMLAAGRRDELFRVLNSDAQEQGGIGEAGWRAYQRLGVFSLRAGDADTARQALLTAARISKGRAIEPQIALSDFYRTVGDDAAASQRLRMAYFLDPRNTDVRSRMVRYNEVPGPTYALVPKEQAEAAGTLPEPGEQ